MAGSSEFTISDVAKAAGVSISTVSRILNGRQDVAQATRQRVQEVIEELGYAPHAQARSLRARKTRNLALLFPLKYPGNLPYNPLETDFMIGAAAATGENDFSFSLLTTPVTKRSLLSLYRSMQIDGLVLMGIHTQDWRVDLLHQHDYPFVMIGRCADNSGVSFIDLDFEGSVLAAFAHMVELGHRHIGFLALPSEMHRHGFGPSVRGWAGYERALEAFQIAPLYREVNYVGQDVYEATLDMLDEQPNLTAIITTQESAPPSVIAALRRRGRHVPGDCSLVALMTDRIAQLNIPSMTYMDFPSYEMGYQAIEMLIRRLEDDLAEPEQILMPPRLVIGDSTSPLK